MKIIEGMTQNTQEWVEFRRSRLGASDIATLMFGTKSDIKELIRSKLTGKDKFVTDAMKRGSMMEPEARLWFNNMYGYNAESVVALHDEYDWFMASLDFLDLQKGILLEIKCPVSPTIKAEDNAYYKRWWWQIQAQLSVTNLRSALLMIFSEDRGSIKTSITTIDRDEDAIAQIIATGSDFMAKLKDMSVEDCGLPEKSDDLHVFAALRWEAAKSDYDAAKIELDLAKEELVSLSENESFASNGVKVQKIEKKGEVDYKAIEILKGIDLEVYRKPSSTYWKISLEG